MELNPNKKQSQKEAENVEQALTAFTSITNQPTISLKTQSGSITPWGAVSDGIANITACITAVKQIEAQTEQARIAKDVFIKAIEEYTKVRLKELENDMQQFTINANIGQRQFEALNNECEQCVKDLSTLLDRKDQTERITMAMIQTYKNIIIAKDKMRSEIFNNFMQKK